MPRSFPLHAGDDDVAGRVLHEVSTDLNPREDVRSRIKRRMASRIEPQALLIAARDGIRPDRDTQAALLKKVTSRLASFPSFWERLRALSSPNEEFQFYVKRKVFLRLQPQYLSSTARFLRVAAAFAVLLLLVRLSPSFVLPQHTIADSPVILIPEGEVSVLRDGLWQPVTEEVTMQKGAQIRTGEGTATLIARADGVVRLADHTTVSVPDFANSSAQDASRPATFTLGQGTIWVQGLMPARATPGWRFVVQGGSAGVNEGSLSIASVEDTNVEVWNRSAEVGGAGQEVILVSGEGVDLSPSTTEKLQVHTLEKQSSWVLDNLKRDAVHRREIAQEQQQRLAQNAGILPNSVLYPVKRAAEAVDMLMTFGKEARAQKMLDQADTRLSEAAALLVSGSGSDAEAPLQEYKNTLLAVASGSGQGMDVRALVREQLSTEVADVSAALPGDASYLLKQTVLEATAALPDSTVKPADVQGAMLVDTLASLDRRAQEGDPAGAAAAFQSYSSMVAMIDASDSPLSSEVRKEARASLTLLAKSLEDAQQEDATGSLLLGSGLERFLPSPVGSPQSASLTDAEVDAIAQAIKSRIFRLKMPRSRYDQLLAESRALDGHPDQGRILRRLYHILPQEGLAPYVRTEFARIRKAQ